MHDLNVGRVLMKNQMKQPLFCLDYNPDGHLLVMGSRQGQCLIYSLSDDQMAEVLTLNNEHDVTALSFSNNGYHMASLTTDNVVSLWDLRKTDKLFH